MHAVGVGLHGRKRDVHPRFPALFFGVNLESDFQYVGMDTKEWRDFVQLCIRLQVISQLQPTLSGCEMMRVGWRQRFHT